MARVDLRERPEEEPVLRHRLIDARAGEDVGGETAEDRDEDRRGDESRRPRSQERLRRRFADAGRGREDGNRKRPQIDEIDQCVDPDERRGPGDQSARDVAAGIAHLSRRESEAVPAVVGPQDGNHRDAPKGASTPGGSGAPRSGRTGAATKRPTPASAAREPIFRIVTRFWTQAPSLTPAKLTAVRNAIERTPATPPPVSFQLDEPDPIGNGGEHVLRREERDEPAQVLAKPGGERGDAARHDHEK